jgi:hypothetical protein
MFLEVAFHNMHSLAIDGIERLAPSSDFGLVAALTGATTGSGVFVKALLYQALPLFQVLRKALSVRCRAPWSYIESIKAHKTSQFAISPIELRFF